MGNEFKSVMEKRSDYELLVITEDLRSEYQPEAVAAADEEVKKRNFDHDKVRKIQAELDRVEECEEENKGFTERVHGDMPKKQVKIIWTILSICIPFLYLIYSLLFKEDNNSKSILPERLIVLLFTFANIAIILLITLLVNAF